MSARIGASRFAAAVAVHAHLAVPPKLPLSEVLIEMAERGNVVKLGYRLKGLKARQVNVEEIVYREFLTAAVRCNLLPRSWRLMVDMEVRPAPETLYKVFKTLREYNRVDSAKRFRTELHRAGVQLNNSTLAEFGRVLDPSTDMDLLLQTCNDILQAGEPLVGDAQKVFTKVMMCFAKVGDVTAVHRMVKELQGYGVAVEGIEYVHVSVITALGRRRDLSGVDSALERAKQYTTPSIITYNALMEAYQRCGRLDLAIETFEHIISPESSLVATRVTYNIAMDTLARSGNVRRAEDLLNEMQQRNLKPRPADLNVILNGYALRGLPHHAEALIARSEIACDNISHAILVNAHARNGSLAKAKAALVNMLDTTTRPEELTDTFNTLLNAYVRRRELSQLKELEKLMVERNVPKDEVTFNTLCNGYLKNGDAEKAYELLQQMEANGVAPSALSFTSFVFALGKRGELEKAVHMFNAMDNNGIPPDIPAYNALIYAYVRNDDLDGAKRAVEEMYNKGLAPNEVTYTTIIDAYGKQGKLRDAIAVFDQMRRLGLSQNTASYNAIISAYKTKKDLLGVQATYEEMLERKVEPDEITYNALINAAAEGQDLRLLQRAYEAMQSRGLCDVGMTHTAFLYLLNEPDLHVDLSSELGPSFQRSRAAEHDRQVSAGLLPVGNLILPPIDEPHSREVTRQDIVRAAVKNGPESVDVLFAKLEQSGVKPDSLAFSALIRTYAIRGDIGNSMNCLREMLSQNLRPDLGTFNVIIAACAAKRDVDNAADVMNLLTDLRITPNYFTYNAMMYIYAISGNLNSVLAIRKSLKRNIAPDLGSVL